MWYSSSPCMEISSLLLPLKNKVRCQRSATKQQHWGWQGFHDILCLRALEHEKLKFVSVPLRMWPHTYSLSTGIFGQLDPINRQNDSFPRVKTVLYLDLIHVHNSPGGSLCAQAVLDALVQSHAVELTVVSCLPPKNINLFKTQRTCL